MPRPKVFISYNSQDRAIVVEIARKLAKTGEIDVWMDVWELKPGDDWMTGLQDGLRACTCCAVFFGASGAGPWQNQEIQSSINRAVRSRDGSFRVIPVLLPGGSRNLTDGMPDFLELRTWAEFRRSIDEEDAFETLKWGISGRGAPSPFSFDGLNPYRGLEAFDVKDARFFCGRDEVIDKMFVRLQAMLNGASGRKLLVLVGNSGCGKSSLARAGLIGAIKAGRFPVEGSAQWPVAIFKPGGNPLENAAVELAAAGSALGNGRDAGALRDALKNGNQELNFYAKQVLHGQPAGARLIVVVDQFEECFTNCEDENAREKFFGNLVYAIQATDGPVLTVFTLRADFYNECLRHAALGGLVSSSLFPVQPMTREELRSAIERPAQLAGLTFEPGLVDVLLAENLDKPSCLPLLQFTLSELWRVSKPRITHEAYNSIGRTGGALAGKAEEVFNRLTPEQQEICHHLFMRLVTRTDRSRYTRHRVAFSELITQRANADQLRRLLQKLTGEGSRLLTVEAETTLAGSEPANSGPGEETDYVGLAHEVLIESWPRFGEWLKEDSEFQLWRDRLSRSIEQWRNVNRKRDALMRGKLLSEALGWQRRNQPDLNAEENDFINQSRKYEWREIALEVATLCAFLGLAGVLLYIWIDKTRVAFRQSQQLYAEALASISRNFDDSELIRPLLISMYAVQTSETQETMQALEDAVLRAGGPVAEHDGTLRAVSSSGDGKVLAAAWEDGTVQLWEPRTDAPNGADPAHVYRKVGSDVAAQASVAAMVISSDGGHLAVAGNHAGIDFWDLPGRAHRVVEFPQGAIKSIDLDKGAGNLLVAAWDSPVAVQSVGQGGGPKAIRNTEHAWQAVFCPVDRCAGIALASGAAAIQDLASDTMRNVAKGSEAIKSIEFSRDGKNVAVGDATGAAKLLSAGSGTELAHFMEDSGVDRILISPDGKFVVTVNSGGAATVWDAGSGEQRMKLRARDSFRSAVFARFGDAPHVAFGTSGGKLLIYDLDPKHLRKRAYEVWAANGKPALSAADCSKYLHQKSCPAMDWNQ